MVTKKLPYTTSFHTQPNFGTNAGRQGLRTWTKMDDWQSHGKTSSPNIFWPLTNFNRHQFICNSHSNQNTTMTSPHSTQPNYGKNEWIQGLSKCMNMDVWKPHWKTLSPNILWLLTNFYNHQVLCNSHGNQKTTMASPLSIVHSQIMVKINGYKASENEWT